MSFAYKLIRRKIHILDLIQMKLMGVKFPCVLDLCEEIQDNHKKKKKINKIDHFNFRVTSGS